MADVPGAQGWKVAALAPAVKGAEFVLCNGDKTQWDNPPPQAGSKNYRTAETDGDWTLRHGRLMRLHDHPVMIVSDLDHTMVGHEHDPENAHLREFQAQWLGRFAFAGSFLCYSTGRNKTEALKVAIERELLRPKLLICAVGTEVYLVPEDLPLEGGSWAHDPDRITLDDDWTRKMEETFNRKAAQELLLTSFPKFDVRGNPETDPFRIPTAYEVDAEWEEQMLKVRAAMGPTVEVISSGGAEWKLVDFCSAEAGKRKGVEFAMQHLGMPPERTLVCGDSGNDESMYRSPGVRGVAVGNSLPELVATLRSTAQPGPEAVQHGQVFKTNSGSSVLYATQPVAAAISEALERFWPARG